MTYTAKNEEDYVAQIFLEKLEKDLRRIWSKKKFKDPTNMILRKKINAITIKLLNVISVVKMDLLKVTKRRTKSETTAT